METEINNGFKSDPPVGIALREIEAGETITITFDRDGKQISEAIKFFPEDPSFNTCISCE